MIFFQQCTSIVCFAQFIFLLLLFKFTNKRDENLVKPLIADHDGIIVQTMFEFQEPVVKLVFKTSMHQISHSYTGFQVVFSLADNCKYQVF